MFEKEIFAFASFFLAATPMQALFFTTCILGLAYMLMRTKTLAPEIKPKGKKRRKGKQADDLNSP